jgi:RimJ/RimL family protein N-acetyltransferase
MIRPATLDDLAALIDGGERFLRESEYGPHFPLNRAQLEATLRHLLAREDAAVLLLEHAGVPQGAIGGVVLPHIFSGELYAAEIFWWVHPEHRGGGLRLLHAFEAWARERGAVFVAMLAPNLRVAGLYRRLGYVEIETGFMRRFKE